MKKLFMLAGIILAVSSCSEQPAPYLEDTSVLRLSGMLEFEKAPSASVTKTTTEIEILKESLVGVYVVTTTGGDGREVTDFGTTPPAWKNALFSVDVDGVITGSDPIMLWPGIPRYGIYAYAPRRDVTPTNANMIAVSHGTDILWAKSENVAAAVDATTDVELTFEHCGSQVKFQLIDGSGEGVLNLAVASLTVSGFSTAGNLDVATGVLTLDDLNQTLSWSALGTNESSNTNILVNRDAAINITVVVDNVTQMNGQPENEYRRTVDYHFETGKAYTVNVTVGGIASQIIIDPTITDWTTISAGVDAM